MSTRSRIGIESEDGTVTSVYCHYDGYPSGVGNMLLTHFNGAERAVYLQQHGDLSFIGGPEFCDEGVNENSGVVAYRRWRNEENVDPRVDESRAAYLGTEQDWDIEYYYLYGPRGWEYAERGDPAFRRLTPAAIAKSE